MMKDLIKQIKNGENVEDVLKMIISDFFINGPVNSCFLEIISYIKLYQPETLALYEEDILCMMGLYFKKDLKGSNNIKTLLLKNFMDAILNKYDDTFTPVQANIIDNVDNNKYFSFSSATSTGKSFVFRKLILEEVGDIVIIVPSRALINEYYIRVSSVVTSKETNILTFPDVINTKNASKNIFILTPERSKELFKIKDKINIKLVLFDEAQIGDEESKRGILFDSIVRRIKKNFPSAKMLFAHPYIENPSAQLEKNLLVDENYEAINYNYKNVGQIYTCVDKAFNYYHFGIEKTVMGNQKEKMDYDPIEKCISENGTVLIYTSKSSIYNGTVLEHMNKYIEKCAELTDEKALKYILQIKELIGGSSDEKRSTYSKLLNLLKKGVVIHHGSLPLSVRLIIEKFTQDGFCRLCFATSTLYQGINMPFDIVYIKRFEASKNLLIKNLIGRAGRSTIEKKFDYGQIIVSVENMSELRNCLKVSNTISNESLLDIIKEDDDTEIIEFKEAINNNEFNDDYNMTNNQLQRLNDEVINNALVNILDNLLKDNKFISSEEYNAIPNEKKELIMTSFEMIYEKHLNNRDLTDSEKKILDNAIKIFIWQINGKKFKEIIGYVNDNIRMYKKCNIKMHNFVHSFCYTFNSNWRYNMKNLNKLKQELIIMKTNNIKPNYSELARLHKCDRRTVKKYDNGYVGKPINRKKESKLDRYKDDIKSKLDLPGATIKGVFQYFKDLDTNIGNYSNFYKYVIKNELVSKHNNSFHPRYETDFGEQLQFDWKEDIKMFNKYGEIFEFNIFSSTLSASRLHIFIYSKYKTKTDVERCLIKTFQYIGGVTKETLTDNMSSIVNTKEKKFYKEFISFAKDIGFQPKKCKVKHPFTKGKDESCNRFMSWLIPYNGEFETEEDLIKIIENINLKVNKQINETIGVPPIMLFQKEKEYLKPLPSNKILNSYLYDTQTTKVSNESLFYYKGSKYSVPTKFINHTLNLREENNKLYVYYNKDLITIHDISNKYINYKQEHYNEGFMNILKNKTQDEIDNIARRNLDLINKLSEV